MLVPGLKRASAAGLRSDGAGSEVVDGGVTVSVVVRLTPPKVAVIVTAVLAVTAEVLTPNVALEAPADTVTLAGTETTDVFALLSVTTAPPLGAPPVNVIVPCAAVPPLTEVGLTLTADKLAVVVAGAVTVSVVVRLTPPKVAVIVTGVFAVTAEVLTPKFALDAPAATVTLAGTETTDVFALLSVTTAPPLGAPPVNVIVPCAAVPPLTEVGLTLTADRLAVVVVDAAWAVNRREAENGPATPAELKARTRQKNRCAARPVTVVCDTATV